MSERGKGLYKLACLVSAYLNGDMLPTVGNVFP